MVARSGDVSNGDDGAQAIAQVQADPGSARRGLGLRVLTVMATPLNYLTLRALREQPMRLAELRRATGLPAQTTLRAHLASLVEIGAVDKRPTTEMPYAVEHELTSMGREMLGVASRLETWLARAPGGPVALDGGAAKGIIKAFVDGWGSSMLRGLGTGPMSLTELDRGIADLSYPALERRLASMRMAGLIQACRSDGVGTPYAVTEWARRGVGPLIAAGRCERRHMRERAPITRDDVEAAFLLTLPLVGLPTETSGCCQLEVDADPAESRDLAGVRVTVRHGRVVACEASAGPTAEDFAAGSAETWLEAAGGNSPTQLQLGGDVAAGVVSGLHSALGNC
jgi:DNA-binding HxlR family transcriptional regulator